MKQKLLFPLAAAVNLFSVTALLIMAGLSGQAGLAADIAIVQAAIVAIFLSLSGNARNLILAGGLASDEKSLLYFRLVTMIPAAVAVYFLTKSTFDISLYLVIGLIIRKCTEWVAELQLANKEKKNDSTFVLRYIQLNTLAFIGLVLMLIIPSGIDYFLSALYIWAFLPIAFTAPYLKSIFSLKAKKVNLIGFIPHIGSSTIIGISMYVFRVLILILAGKAIAGQMFTAYALGGVISSLYTFAIGPSLIHQKAKNKKPLLYFISLCIFTGVVIVLASFSLGDNLFSQLFMQALGYSLVGGGIMLVSQSYRLHIIQVCKKDVFIPDVLANILLIVTIPFSYYLFKEIAFTMFFLLSAILNLLFYAPLFRRNKLTNA
jgi:hypothetical protein